MDAYKYPAAVQYMATMDLARRIGPVLIAILLLVRPQPRQSVAAHPTRAGGHNSSVH